MESLGMPLPTYQDAMCTGCSIPMADLRLTPPPPYETVCQTAEPILTYEVSSTREDRVASGSHTAIETQNVLEALDKEFRWTAILFGVSVSVLVLTILIVIIAFAQRENSQ